MQALKLSGWGPPPYPWINYEVPLTNWCGYSYFDTTPQDNKPTKLILEVWNKCPTCQRDFATTFKNPTQKDFDNIAEHLNKDIPLCQECGCYYE